MAPPAQVTAKRNGRVEVKLAVHVQSGYHVNSNAPADAYLIPLRLRWEAGPLAAAEIVYPKPELEQYEFSEKPLAVFTGDFDILTWFHAGPKAPAGPGVLTGKLRYQACNHTTCFAPKTAEVQLPYQIK